MDAVKLLESDFKSQLTYYQNISTSASYLVQSEKLYQTGLNVLLDVRTAQFFLFDCMRQFINWRAA